MAYLQSHNKKCKNITFPTSINNIRDRLNYCPADLI